MRQRGRMYSGCGCVVKTLARDRQRVESGHHTGGQGQAGRALLDPEREANLVNGRTGQGWGQYAKTKGTART